MKDFIENKPVSTEFPSLILGLDISTSCIGISIIYDDGCNDPSIELLTHVTPKIPKNVTGIEALILRKEIFENDFLSCIDETLNKIKCPLKKITECVIESPMVHTSAGSNALTVAKLLQFNGLLSEAVYRVLKIIPYYISSYDARMYSFPELLALRRFNKKGELYDINHAKKALKENKLILFGNFPFDCDKKQIMMNIVNEKYPYLPWILNKKGDLKKENYDSCDALVCALAYSNIKRNKEVEIEPKGEVIDIVDIGNNLVSFSYNSFAWGKKYEKTQIFIKKV